MPKNAPIAFSSAVAILLAAAASPARSQSTNMPYQSSYRGAYGSGLGQSTLPQGSEFEPRVEAAVQYVDNLNLAEDGESQVSAFGIELANAFRHLKKW